VMRVVKVRLGKEGGRLIWRGESGYERRRVDDNIKQRLYLKKLVVRFIEVTQSRVELYIYIRYIII
jgi:hypothetical protein